MTQSLPLAAILLMGLDVGGCSPRDGQYALQEYILDGLPRERFHEERIDFSGVCSIEGFWLGPDDVVHPGQVVDVSVYWHSRRFFLDAYWYLFTHLLNQDGMLIGNLDSSSPLRSRVVSAGPSPVFPGGVDRRQVLGPPEWMPGKIYVDRIQFSVPEQDGLSGIAIAVGIWNGVTRLRITEGPVVGQDAGLLARLAVSQEIPSR